LQDLRTIPIQASEQRVFSNVTLRRFSFRLALTVDY